MKLQGEFTFQGTREEVWELLQDPEILATALPGAKKMEKTAEDKYEAVMEVRIGPVAGSFSSTVELNDKVVPESYSMKVEGKGGPGFVKGTAKITLEEKSGNQTLMKYDAELQVGGKLASVGQRLLDTVGKSMAKQSLESMNNALQHRVDVHAKTEYIPPSQAKFAVEVAKDVTKSYLSSAKVWGIIILFLTSLALAAWLLSK